MYMTVKIQVDFHFISYLFSYVLDHFKSKTQQYKISFESSDLYCKNFPFYFEIFFFGSV